MGRGQTAQHKQRVAEWRTSAVGIPWLWMRNIKHGCETFSFSRLLSRVSLCALFLSRLAYVTSSATVLLPQRVEILERRAVRSRRSVLRDAHVHSCQAGACAERAPERGYGRSRREAQSLWELDCSSLLQPLTEAVVRGADRKPLRPLLYHRDEDENEPGAISGDVDALQASS